jgi:hypothetical protein
MSAGSDREFASILNHRQEFSYARIYIASIGRPGIEVNVYVAIALQAL